MLRAKKIWFYTLAATIFTGSSAFAVDTLNKIDENNMKQGHWVYTNKMKNLPNYKEDQVVEEGDYDNDKKIGKWMRKSLPMKKTKFFTLFFTNY